MRRTSLVVHSSWALVSLLAAACSSAAPGASEAPGVSVEEGATARLSTYDSPNGAGTLRTYTDNPLKSLNPTAVAALPFVASFGTNGRACVHCHVPADGWGTSAVSVQYRFSHPLDTTKPACVANAFSCAAEPKPANYGRDPIFRLVDGANSPVADVSTADARRAAYSMLLSKALIRVELPIPAESEFELAAVDDPYHYANASHLSLFRRPLPSTNLRLASGEPVLTTVMWDGRETKAGHDIISDLLDQANGATLGHAQATSGLSDADRRAIVDFETGLHTAQQSSTTAGDLTAAGASGGPQWLGANQSFYVGINDPFTGDSHTHAAFTSNVFDIYSAWSGAKSAARAQIARGEALFNSKPIALRGVRGVNDALGLDVVNATCTTCHDSPNYGHHSIALPLDLGLTDAVRRTADMPLYTLRNKATGAVIQSTDPGRALVTGRWADVGKFKGPILRGLAARAPYFHNGSAATVADVVSFYDGRFGIGFTESEKADLSAFLLSL